MWPTCGVPASIVYYLSNINAKDAIVSSGKAAKVLPPPRPIRLYNRQRIGRSTTHVLNPYNPIFSRILHSIDVR